MSLRLNTGVMQHEAMGIAKVCVFNNLKKENKLFDVSTETDETLSRQIY